MDVFLTTYREEILQTLITIVILVIVRFIFHKAAKKVGELSDFNTARTTLIIKYINVSLSIMLAAILSLIWGVNFNDLGLILSSVFAVIGVALFAQWSILSNITAGVILFFSFPYKIGDRIKILNKDFPTEGIIEDIKAFHMHLRTDDGELITYPNNLFLQIGVTKIEKDSQDDAIDSI
ncbi:mechanosensitive ion channel domain-containing protein [Zhouia amylolytica]|uniref:mechanosensitive ion channel domain-containing protein n=1 Tax=Zhouia amylolytica TaxID=376730 RepID=UPI0020CF8F96|nr:mechanosensitive ion channel domain-containing protein [Zhouia amylolytica]MCQ0112184.1 mechanosensitive ion channel [Zhouia amylolytica]